MLSLVIAALLAIHIGPVAPDVPSRQPQMAAQGSTVVLVFGAGKAVYFSSSHDAGKTFSSPRQIAQAAILPLTRHRGPRVALSRGVIVITAVTGTNAAEGPHAHGLPRDGDLLAWRSTDGGETWSKGVAINDAPGAPSEGLHALAAGDNGNLFAVWLDKRSAKGTALYGARSTDSGATWSKNIMIYESPEGTICECCHPSVAIDPAGQVVVMWRNWLAGSRDLYLIRSLDGVVFSQPQKLGTGTWQLNACPMDGGGLAVLENRVVTAWRREHQIFLASPGEAEIPVGTGVDVSLAAGKTGVYAVWSTPGGGIQVLAPGKRTPAVLAPQGGYPSVVALDQGALAAWEDGGKIALQAIP